MYNLQYNVDSIGIVLWRFAIKDAAVQQYNFPLWTWSK